ncbi:D-hexose-6-phosphate mutarotase [Ideonella livida]|uniref:D-hexose-6-phosphate mutarotase n=1 Tax=Ideonella livida TaxID=2707176 RepID=UPI002873CDFB|nr:D-hexose-6-phosphate mutarotase [Ideonella livida]
MTSLVDFQGHPALRLRAPDGAQATVLLHGAHLVSWIPAGGEEQLYLSPTARYGDGQAVRGGVPVVFPQFNLRGPLPHKHGFVRTRAWSVAEQVVRAGCAIGVMRLESDAATRALWPHDFALELTVIVSGRELEIELSVTNTGTEAFEFTSALHTYLRCHDALRLQLEGLQDVGYEDAVLGEVHTQWGDVLTVVGELDRIYRQVGGRTLTLRELGHRVHLQQTGFEDVVVWNPGDEKCAALPDMPDADWRQMLCVEAASITEPVWLEPGAEWAGMQQLQC